jgi:hypothetical protein
MEGIGLNITGSGWGKWRSFVKAVIYLGFHKLREICLLNKDLFDSGENCLNI